MLNLFFANYEIMLEEKLFRCWQTNSECILQFNTQLSKVTFTTSLRKTETVCRFFYSLFPAEERVWPLGLVMPFLDASILSLLKGGGRMRGVNIKRNWKRHIFLLVSCRQSTRCLLFRNNLYVLCQHVVPVWATNVASVPLCEQILDALYVSKRACWPY